MVKKPQTLQEVIEVMTESKPNPDPSVITTENIYKGLDGLEKLLSARIHCSEENVIRLEKFLASRQETIDKTVHHLQALQDEKFKGVEKQFTERDTRTDKTAELNQKAIDAALTAAEKSRVTQNETSEKAIAKSEVAMIKQIDLQAALLQTETKALYAIIEDLKSRLNVKDGQSKGEGDVWGKIAAGIATLALLIGIFIGIFSLFQGRKDRDTAPPAQVIYIPAGATLPTIPPK